MNSVLVGWARAASAVVISEVRGQAYNYTPFLPPVGNSLFSHLRLQFFLNIWCEWDNTLAIALPVLATWLIRALLRTDEPSSQDNHQLEHFSAKRTQSARLLCSVLFAPGAMPDARSS